MGLLSFLALGGVALIVLARRRPQRGKGDDLAENHRKLVPDGGPQRPLVFRPRGPNQDVYRAVRAALGRTIATFGRSS